MNYYELIYLKNELKNKLTNGVLEQAISPYRNMLELFIDNDEKSCRLLFSTAPGNIALFTDTYRPGKKSNTVDFFEDCYGQRIKEIILPGKDRLLGLEFEESDIIWFRLFSNKANALLTRNDTIVETFKTQDEIGKPAPKPKEPGNVEIAGTEDLSVKQMVLKLNPAFPRDHLDELINIHHLQKLSDEELTGWVRSQEAVLSNNAAFRLLADGSTTLFDEKTLSLQTERSFSDVNELISYRYKNYSNRQRLKQQRGELTKAINRQIKRNRSSLNNLYQADKGLERAEEYEKYGHLLMANAHLNHDGDSNFETDDLYNEGNLITIPIDPSLSLAENAEHYYKRAKNSERSYEEATEMIPKLEGRKKELESLKEEIGSIQNIWELLDWKKEHAEIVDELLPGKKNQSTQSLPFHQLKVKDVEVWIGKNAFSNDKLVQSGHKEDVWMHARGVPGSHVLIRMNNNKGMPDKELVKKVASYAAYNSKARGAGLVPVIVTKLKYVRKPKGAAAGAVIVQKEEVELVIPEKPEI